MLPELLATNRSLKYPLKNPTVASTVVGTGDIQNTVLSNFPLDINERVTVTMELSLREYITLATTIDVGRDIAYGEQSDVVWWLWCRAFMGAQVPPETITQTETVTRYVTQFIENSAQKSEQEMPRHDIVKKSGQWFIQIDCGCDDAIYIPLSSAVQLDENGDPISGSDGGEFGGGFSNGGGGAGGSWDGSVSSGNASCYAENAVAYLLARAESFFYAVINYDSLGTAIETPATETFINFQNLFASILFGNNGLSYIRTLSKAAVSAMLADVDLIAALEGGWSFTGSVNRNQLKNWIAQYAPSTVNGLAASTMLISWLDYSIVAGYNNDLATIAASCESGESPVIPFAYEWVKEYDFTIDSQTWLVSGSTNAVYDAGIGWRQNLSGDKTIEIRHPDAQYVTGIIIYLTREFNGDTNEITFRNSSLGAAVVTEVQSGDVLTVPVDYNFGSTFALGIEEDSLGTSVDNMWITKCVVYGTGAVPSGGTTL